MQLVSLASLLPQIGLGRALQGASYWSRPWPQRRVVGRIHSTKTVPSLGNTGVQS